MIYRILLIVLCLVLSGGAFAKEGTVKTSDGNTFTGDIQEEADKVIVSVKGIITTLDRSDIASIEYPSGADEEFAARMKKLAKDDVAGRIDLARWAFDKSRYDLSRRALDDAIRIDPNSREAYDMMQTVSQQMALESKKSAGSGRNDVPDRDNPPATAPGDRPRRPLAAGARQFLSQDQINQVRQFELRSADTNVRIRLDGDVQRTHAERVGTPVIEFRKKPMLDQALAILEGDDEDSREKVHVLSDPAAILTFKRDVQGFVVNGCATSGCHGGNNPGGFVLTNSTESDASTYTNFYILSTYTQEIMREKESSFNAQRSMISRASPETSLLATYALPAAHTDTPHPTVPGYRAIFRDKSDPRYRSLINWIGRTLRPAEPAYGFDFDPVGGGVSTSQPAGDER